MQGLDVCVLDFEATCWEKPHKKAGNNEIIEVPSVLLRCDSENKMREVSRIQIFVKPLKDPVVSEFCHKLTGITQAQVDSGVDLMTAIKKHSKWLATYCPTGNVVIATCGAWDLDKMLPADLHNFNSKPFGVYKHYVNVKNLFCYAKDYSGSYSMTDMLFDLGLELEGRHHSGIDDCHNIGRIFTALTQQHMLDEGKIKKLVTKEIIKGLTQTVSPYLGAYKSKDKSAPKLEQKDE